MPRFRFVAADSTGQVTDGTIDAATQTDARSKLASNGLAVRELEEVVATGPAPPALPRRAAAMPNEPRESLPPPRRPRAQSGEAKERGSAKPLVFSILALVLTLATSAYVVYRDPPWGRLSRYDFHTPESAYLSHLRIEAHGDIQAMVELQRKAQGKQIREKLDTVKVHHSQEYHGKRVLFIEYQLNGAAQREVAYFESDPEHGKEWKRTYISEQEIRQSDQALAEEIMRWRSMAGGPGFEQHPGGFPE